MRARTAAANELKAFIVTADEQLRAEFRWLRTNKDRDTLLAVPRQRH